MSFSAIFTQIDWVLVARGMTSLYAIAFFLLRWTSGRAVLSCLARLVTGFFGFATDGSAHLFDYLSTGLNMSTVASRGDRAVELATLQPVFAFRVFPVILLVGSLVNLLFYLQLMQAVVFRVGGVIRLFVGCSICESACAGANIFMGMRALRSSRRTTQSRTVETKATATRVFLRCLPGVLRTTRTLAASPFGTVCRRFGARVSKEIKLKKVGRAVAAAIELETRIAFA
ncbi:hypothetical protein HPB50_026643 [Hyalomma asiaticum]|uniref:Uncharacterized protein n=1 Tax=Hyalomma asiaticum TaxID=266040 RepID=A0ACB7T250_HYAAI|nr:hypothetical protein HPB50_026643 [Hyalomma asiaticum]